MGILTLGLLSPGPDFLLILRNSIGPSTARAFGTALGIACGLIVQAGAVSLGFAALPPTAMRLVQLVGAAYLAYLGVRALLSRPAVAPTEAEILAQHSAHGGFRDGLICNITNPKVTIFFAGVFAPMLPPDSTLLWRVVVPVSAALHGLVLWSLIVLALRSPPVARQLGRAQHWLPRAFGVLLLAMATAIAWEALRN